MCHKVYYSYRCAHTVQDLSRRVTCDAVRYEAGEDCCITFCFSRPPSCKLTRSHRYSSKNCPSCRKHRRGESEEWIQERVKQRKENRQRSTRAVSRSKSTYNERPRREMEDQVGLIDVNLRIPKPKRARSRRDVYETSRYNDDDYEPLSAYLPYNAGYYGAMRYEEQPYTSEKMMKATIEPVSPLAASDFDVSVVSIPPHDEYAQYRV